ncbi:MAG: D-xylose ABC transporter ATP-binding protein, partial [Firmicutes bacterium]|nr:D-xylose ABC transporter ATP-binding protein [Bacillota bacterium]
VEIYKLIADVAKSGIGIIVISSELPEIIGLCHRVLVMREGSVEGELKGKFSEEDVMMYATGVMAN